MYLAHQEFCNYSTGIQKGGEALFDIAFKATEFRAAQVNSGSVLEICASFCGAWLV